jgi:hypothetical protein
MRDSAMHVQICALALSAFLLAGCDGDSRTVYRLNESNNEWGLQSGASREYKISGENILTKIGNFVNLHENCEVWDLDNWSCTEDNGDYFLGSQTADTLKYHPQGPQKSYRNWLGKKNKCDWWAKDDDLFGIFVMCPLIFVFAK